MSSDAQPTPPADGAPPPPPSALKKNLPFVLALVGGLAAGGASGAFFVGPVMAKGITPQVMAAGAAHPKAESHDEEEGAEEEAAADEEEGASEGEHGGKEGEKAAEAPVYTLDNLVLNPAESGGTRFLLLSITFETKTAVVDQMKARDAELRDVVLVTLGAKTVEQLADVKVREAMKHELVTAAGKLFKTKAIKRVYFPQFVIQ